MGWRPRAVNFIYPALFIPLIPGLPWLPASLLDEHERVSLGVPHGRQRRAVRNVERLGGKHGAEVLRPAIEARRSRTCT